jgi:hypothetical protein
MPITTPELPLFHTIVQLRERPTQKTPRGKMTETETIVGEESATFESLAS